MESSASAQKLLTGMRGGYGGMLMIGMVGTLAGLALLNPLSLGAGVLFGVKTVRDEKQAAAAKRRQAEAKTAVRKHIDEVTFQVGKDSRRHAAAHPAPAARPLQRAGRGGEHLDRRVRAGRAERA